MKEAKPCFYALLHDSFWGLEILHGMCVNSFQKFYAYICFLIESIYCGAGEFAQQLRTLVAVTEDVNWSLSIHMEAQSSEL